MLSLLHWMFDLHAAVTHHYSKMIFCLFTKLQLSTQEKCWIEKIV